MLTAADVGAAAVAVRIVTVVAGRTDLPAAAEIQQTTRAWSVVCWCTIEATRS